MASSTPTEECVSQPLLRARCSQDSTGSEVVMRMRFSWFLVTVALMPLVVVVTIYILYYALHPDFWHGEVPNVCMIARAFPESGIVPYGLVGTSFWQILMVAVVFFVLKPKMHAWWAKALNWAALAVGEFAAVHLGLFVSYPCCDEHNFLHIVLSYVWAGSMFVYVYLLLAPMYLFGRAMQSPRAWWWYKALFVAFPSIFIPLDILTFSGITWSLRLALEDWSAIAAIVGMFCILAVDMRGVSVIITSSKPAPLPSVGQCAEGLRKGLRRHQVTVHDETAESGTL